MSPDDLPATLLSGLRREVGLLRRAERRRRFPMGVHAGLPGGERASTSVPWPVPDLYDAGLRLDLVDALLARAEHRADDEGPSPSVWLSRPGTTDPHDVDLTWWTSAARASAARGRGPVAFHVVTRFGWVDLPSGASRTWKRLRL